MINRNIFKIAVFIFLFAAQFLLIFPALAQQATNTATPSNVTELENPLGSKNTKIEDIGASVIKTTMGVLGSITLLVFVVGGVMWLTSGGNQERVSRGTKTMLYAIIGIFVIFASYAILSTIIRGLTS